MFYPYSLTIKNKAGDVSSNGVVKLRHISMPEKLSKHRKTRETMENIFTIEGGSPEEVFEAIEPFETQVENAKKKHRDNIEIAYKRAMLYFDELIAINEEKKKASAEITFEVKKAQAKSSESRKIEISTLDKEKQRLEESSPFSRVGSLFRTGLNMIKGAERPADLATLRSFIERTIPDMRAGPGNKMIEVPYRLHRIEAERLTALLGKTHDPIETITRLRRLFEIDSADIIVPDRFNNLVWFTESKDAVSVLETMKQVGFAIKGDLGAGLYPSHDVGPKKTSELLLADPHALETVEINKSLFKNFFDETSIQLQPDSESVAIVHKVLNDPDALDFCKKFKDHFDTYFLEHNIKALGYILSFSSNHILADIVALDSFINFDSVIHQIFHGFYNNEEKEYILKIKQLEPISRDQETLSGMQKVSEIVGKKLYIETTLENIHLIKKIKPHWKEIFAYCFAVKDIHGFRETKFSEFNALEELSKIAELMENREFSEILFDPFLKEFYATVGKKVSIDFRDEWRNIWRLSQDKEFVEIISSEVFLKIVEFCKHGSFFTNYKTYVEVSKIDNILETLKKIDFFSEKSAHLLDPDFLKEIAISGLLERTEELERIKSLFGYISIDVVNVHLYNKWITTPGMLDFIERIIAFSVDKQWHCNEFAAVSTQMIQMPVERAVACLFRNNFSNSRFNFLESERSREMFFEEVGREMEEQNNGQKERLEQEKILRTKRIERSFSVKNDTEQLSLAIQEKIDQFKNKYGPKGETLCALAIVAYGTDDEALFVDKMIRLEEVLDLYDEQVLPKDTRVTLGIEYEVTHSLAEEYGKQSYFGYKGDIELVNRSAGILSGRDAVHEIATKPTDNPYMLLAEVRLLQEAGFLDFNFKKYSSAPRGYHLSIGGESGLTAFLADAFFLDNVMTMASLTGVNAGREVSSTKGIHAKPLSTYFSETKGYRIEFKGMATDSVEQFEKAVLTSYHAGIAMQLSERYLVNSMVSFNDIDFFDSVDYAKIMDSLPEVESEFEGFLNKNKLIIEPFRSNQERSILFAWLSLKKDMHFAIKQHNESFGDSEFNGFAIRSDGEYVDTSDHIDIARNRKLLEKMEVDSQEFRNHFQIDDSLLFARPEDPAFVNSLTRVNNLFLKGPTDKRRGSLANSSVNAEAMLSIVKEEGYKMSDSEETPQQSVFDRKGKIRKGYYYVQGASEEMITHRAQIILNTFNERIEEIISKPEKSSVKIKTNQAAHAI